MNEKQCVPSNETKFIEQVMGRIQMIVELSVDTGHYANAIDSRIFGVDGKESCEKQEEVNCDKDAIFRKLDKIEENVRIMSDVLQKF